MSCPLCDDTGWKPVETNGVRRVERCECWRTDAGQKRLGTANIPRRYQHCTLANFEAYNDSLKRAVVLAQRVIDSFPGAEGGDRGLLLIGMPGVGKTHLAVAILKKCISDRAAHGLFYTTSDLMALLRSTYTSDEKATESQVLRTMTAADVLVLDDLGRERATEWRDEMLHLIVNTRYSERRLTIFTTNFDVGTDMTDPEKDPNTLQCRVGFRIYSRLHEMCEPIHLDAADYRERPPNATADDLIALWKVRKKRTTLPAQAAKPARAQLREPAARDGKADLRWPGGRAGS
jgi:DNA replication protein DnaC